MVTSCECMSPAISQYLDMRPCPCLKEHLYTDQHSDHARSCMLQIANYPFTTLQPQLGILEVDQKQIVLADIPGLIAGASQNKGRGFAFLRHVERTRMLAYVLDLSSVSGMSTGPSPLQQLADLQVDHSLPTNMMPLS